jgi:hypothetical protein
MAEMEFIAPTGLAGKPGIEGSDIEPFTPLIVIFEVSASMANRMGMLNEIGEGLRLE